MVGKPALLRPCRQRFLLAGVLAPKREWEGTLSGNTFQMQTARPTFTPYLHTMATLYQLPTGVTWRTTAVFLARATSECVIDGNNEFRYGSAPTSSLGFGPLAAPAFQAPRGVYVASGKPRIVNNTFTNLEAGVTVGALAGLQVVDNRFADCRLGLRLINPDRNSVQPLRVTCNTVQRTVALGQSAGIFIEPGAQVEFAYRDNAGVLLNGGNGTPGDVAKNLFTGGNSSPGNEFWHVRNDDPQMVTYRTFAFNPLTGGPLTNITTLVTFGQVVVPGLPTARVFDDDFSCQNEDNFTNGIQFRLGLGSLPPRHAQLGIPVPNPADAGVSFTYELPEGVASGELVLRESMNGRVVLRRQLVATESTVTVSVAALPQGLYLGMLTVGGRSLTSVRLQIVR